ncbi:unnamed protein product, partial [marine sediment metagenome]
YSSELLIGAFFLLLLREFCNSASCFLSNSFSFSNGSNSLLIRLISFPSNALSEKEKEITDLKVNLL